MRAPPIKTASTIYLYIQLSIFFFWKIDWFGDFQEKNVILASNFSMLPQLHL